MRKNLLREEAALVCTTKLPENVWECCNRVISLFKFRISVKVQKLHEGLINKWYVNLFWLWASKSRYTYLACIIKSHYKIQSNLIVIKYFICTCLTFCFRRYNYLLLNLKCIKSKMQTEYKLFDYIHILCIRELLKNIVHIQILKICLIFKLILLYLNYSFYN